MWEVGISFSKRNHGVSAVPWFLHCEAFPAGWGFWRHFGSPGENPLSRSLQSDDHPGVVGHAGCSIHRRFQGKVVAVHPAVPRWARENKRLGLQPKPPHDTPLRGRATERFQRDTWMLSTD
jgi:hypothetical protein